MSAELETMQSQLMSEKQEQLTFRVCCEYIDSVKQEWRRLLLNLGRRREDDCDDIPESADECFESVMRKNSGATHGI